MLEGCDCFQRITGASDEHRLLELTACGFATIQLPWSSAGYKTAVDRIVEIAGQGYSQPEDPLGW